MPRRKHKLYFLLTIACLAGYTWLFMVHQAGSLQVGPGLKGCLIKSLTGIPCPSCGATRSVLALLQGEVVGSWQWNPFGIILLAIMVIVPVWVSYDLISHRQSLLQFYFNTEKIFRRKGVA